MKKKTRRPRTTMMKRRRAKLSMTRTRKRADLKGGNTGDYFKYNLNSFYNSLYGISPPTNPSVLVQPISGK